MQSPSGKVFQLPREEGALPVAGAGAGHHAQASAPSCRSLRLRAVRAGLCAGGPCPAVCDLSVDMCVRTCVLCVIGRSLLGLNPRKEQVGGRAGDRYSAKNLAGRVLSQVQTEAPVSPGRGPSTRTPFPAARGLTVLLTGAPPVLAKYRDRGCKDPLHKEGPSAPKFEVSLSLKQTVGVDPEPGSCRRKSPCPPVLSGLFALDDDFLVWWCQAAWPLPRPSAREFPLPAQPPGRGALGQVAAPLVPTPASCSASGDWGSAFVASTPGGPRPSPPPRLLEPPAAGSPATHTAPRCGDLCDLGVADERRCVPRRAQEAERQSRGVRETRTQPCLLPSQTAGGPGRGSLWGSGQAGGPRAPRRRGTASVLCAGTRGHCRNRGAWGAALARDAALRAPCPHARSSPTQHRPVAPTPAPCPAPSEPRGSQSLPQGHPRDSRESSELRAAPGLQASVPAEVPGDTSCRRGGPQGLPRLGLEPRGRRLHKAGPLPAPVGAPCTGCLRAARCEASGGGCGPASGDRVCARDRGSKGCPPRGGLEAFLRAAGCTGPASAPCDFARVCWGRVTPGEGRHWAGANPLPQRRRASHGPACVLLPLPPPQPGLNPDSPLESAATSAHDPASLSQGLVCRVEAELLPREPRTAQVP
ncbi:collagen alpha-1(I) chain-like [Canis lupus familiaris]|uniref:collagen alpha-1(I) chain-like n=1 Tax=Canis lupus familiaris TaxID=9615 RepID=UPI0018F43BF9|nr:collagen alpha-1(I) chain-like [Canis lupus familiaris]